MLAGQLIAAIGFMAAAWIGNHKLNAIHVLVNQRMTDALTEIQALRAYVDDTARKGDPPIPPPLVP